MAEDRAVPCPRGSRFPQASLVFGAPVAEAAVHFTVVENVAHSCLVDRQAITLEVGRVGCKLAKRGELHWNGLLSRRRAILGVILLPEYGVQRAPAHTPRVVVAEGSRVLLKVSPGLRAYVSST